MGKRNTTDLLISVFAIFLIGIGFGIWARHVLPDWVLPAILCGLVGIVIGLQMTLYWLRPTQPSMEGGK